MNIIKKYGFLHIIVLCCLLIFTGCSSTSFSNPTTQNNSSAVDDYSVDISAFSGMPQIDISVDIDKGPDSHLFECVTLTTNNSGKSITEILLYLVKCYDNESPMDSWKYCDRLRISDLYDGSTNHSRWVLGTTIEGATDYKVYLAYVQYEDGSTWGLSNIDHKTVVTRNAEVDVCVYDESTQTSEQEFLVTYSARIVSNSHVGSNWSYGMKVNDTFITPNTIVSVDVANNRGPRLTIYGAENDDNDDYSQEDIIFGKLNIGETSTINEQIVIVENDGRYIGHKAYMEFTVTVTRMSTSVTPSNPSSESVSGNTDADKSVPHTHSYGAWKYYNESNHCQLCSSCNESKYETHKWNGGTTTKNASCSQEGIITYSCSICNAEKKESIPRKEHKWDGGTITQNPSCVKEGIIKYSCSVCATNTYGSIPKVAHSFNQKNESTDYLKTNATYTSGSVYYYSCSCGEKGIETFTINNKKEWISADQLKSMYGYSYSWMGEYLLLWRTDWDTKTDYNYQINGSPKSSFDKEVIYTGSCNGFSVRFKYSQVTNSTSGNIFFYYDDLVSAGIIE